MWLTSCNGTKSNSEVREVAVDLSGFQHDSLTSDEMNKPSPLNLAISAMTSPRETFVYCEQLVDYISERLERSIQFKQRKSYEEVNELVKAGAVDVAFICSGAYVEDSEGKQILEKLHIDRFITGESVDYSGVEKNRNTILR